MPHDLYRSRAVHSIADALGRFKEAQRLDHAGLKGRAREMAVEHVLRPFLPRGFAIASGKILDSTGAQSKETDIIIYNDTILPPILWSQRDGVVPVESAFYAIEVKSRLTATELKDTTDKATALMALRMLQGTYHAVDGTVVPSYIPSQVVFVLFAFSSDLCEKNELDRLSEIDPGTFGATSALQALCVLGKGYWYRDGSVWVEHDPSPHFDEGIDFVSGIVNTLTARLPEREQRGPAWEFAGMSSPESIVARAAASRRPRAPLGEYLMAKRPSRERRRS